jgi:SAM-dependent methyltransferase
MSGSIMDKKNYFIKKGYQNQPVNRTLSVKPGDVYWTQERIRSNMYYQYEAYITSRDLIKNNNLKSVVDIGCGVAGKLMKVIYPVCQDITGIDQKEAIEYCKSHYRHGRFLVDNLEKPKLTPGKFDMIICADVIEHMENPNQLLDYIKKLSKKTSYIVFSTPERDVLRGKDCMASPKPEHIREWNRKELKSYLASREFKVIEHRLMPITKFSLTNKDIRTVRRRVKKAAGTLNINQLVVCQLK